MTLTFDLDLILRVEGQGFQCIWFHVCTIPRFENIEENVIFKTFQGQ